MLTKSRKRSALLVLSLLAALFLTLLILNRTDRGENLRFETYTQQLFCEEVSNNTITLHYTLKNPAAYGITNPPVNMGTISTDSISIAAAAENALSCLRQFQRSKLTDENQLTYDVLENTFTSYIAQAPYTLYEEPLAPLTGTQAQLPLVLSEYQFYTTNDIDTYLELLTKMPEYFRALLDFEVEKSRQGLFMSTESADQIIEECKTFLSLGENNYLYATFQERISELNLSKSQRSSYIEANASCIETYVFPSYQLLKEGLENLRTTGSNPYGLCYLPRGKEYYELLVASETGSYRSIDELKSLANSQIMQDLRDMQEVLVNIPEEISPESDIFSSQGTYFDDSNPLSILTDLRSKIAKQFPAPPDVDIQIKYVTKSMEDYLSPAFYMIPAIDNSKENVIYINSAHIHDDLSLFTTLAHEGYPGHLYQTTYFENLNSAPIRSIMDCGGYTEGWATYCEMLSYYFAPIPKENAILFQKNASVMLGLYALADIGIHYDGWTLAETQNFFSEYGLDDSDTVQQIYALIVGDPGNYLKYYIGYVEFLELKKVAIEKWGEDFTQRRFHQKVLDAGSVPFGILRKWVLAD